MLFVGLLRIFEAKLLKKPVLIVTLDEVCNRYTKFLDGPIIATIDDLLFESLIKALCNSVGLRLSHECEARCNSPELDLVLEMIRKILRPVIHPKRQATGRIGTNRSKPAPERHGNRLEGCQPVAGLGQMPAQTLSVPVLHGGKEPCPAFFRGEYLGTVGAPQNVRGSGDDLSSMLFGRSLKHPVRRE